MAVRKAIVLVGGRFKYLPAADTLDVPFAWLSGKPTTLAGYGITDAAPSANPSLTGFVQMPGAYWSVPNPNTMNAAYNTNALADMWINYRGYLDGFTQFRDFRIGDGKGALVAEFIGSSKVVNFSGAITAVGGTISGVGNLLVTANYGIKIRSGALTDGLDIGASQALAGGTDPDTYIYNRNNGAIWIGTNNTLRGKIRADGVLDWIGTILSAGATCTGDITTYRSAAPTTGYVFWGNTGTKYMGFDGTNYVIQGSNVLAVNGAPVWTSANFDPALKANLASPTFTGEVRVNNGNGSVTHFNYVNGNTNYIRGTELHIDTPQVYRANANSGETRQPRHFVQATDPGLAAVDGDIWTNTA